MSSLLEQYEQIQNQARQSASGTGTPSSQRLPVAGKNPFLSGKSGQKGSSSDGSEQPTFSKQRVDFQLPAGESLYRMVVCDKLIILATKNNTLLRIDLKTSPYAVETLEVKSSSAGDSIDDVFLDPSGRNMLVTMRSGECLYYGRSSKKPRALSKLKTHILTAVGWNHDSSQASPKNGPILLGTAQGAIFETEFNVTASEGFGGFMNSSIENYWKQVCNLAQPEPILIKGIAFAKLAEASSFSTYIVLVATPTRLYHFKGTAGVISEPPFFHEIFLVDSDKPMTNFLELPGSPRNCCLSVWRPSMEQVTSHKASLSFAWLTEPGVYYAEAGNQPTIANRSDDSVLINPQLFAFAKDKTNRPNSVVCTQFHVLIQYNSVVKVLSKLSGTLAFEDPFGDRYGKVMGITRDPASGTVWVYAENAIYKYKITEESRNAWRIYLDKGDYDAALRYAEGNPSNVNLVRICKAENLLKNGRYEESAELFATTEAPFEEITLKFSRLGQEKALKTLLLRKAQSFQSQPHAPSAQLFMICSWLMEIYLNALGHLRSSTNQDSAAYRECLVEFRTFLSTPLFQQTFHTSSDFFFALLQSHSAYDDYVFFATFLNDVKRLLVFHLERDQYREALHLLATQGNPDLMYEFSTQLIRHVPKQTVDIWISKGRALDPHRLLPSFQRFEENVAVNAEALSEIIRYLEHCVHNLATGDATLHNYLLTLYCRAGKEDALMNYLLVADEESTRRSLELYDRKSALRLCVEKGLNHAAVHLYRLLGLTTEAVELALTFDLSLSKTIAKSATNIDQALSKKLWLLIAQHVISRDFDISKATLVLRESDNVIKIEDILPFFPDFVTIDDFKEAICQSLEGYNLHINELKNEVAEATIEADDLRRDIQEYKSHSITVGQNDTCVICKQLLLTQHFFLFDCGHHVHENCLVLSMRQHLPRSSLVLMDDLRKQIDQLKDHDDATSLYSVSSAAAHAISRRDELKMELADIIADECLFCGAALIKSLDLPFIHDEDFLASKDAWL